MFFMHCIALWETIFSKGHTLKHQKCVDNGGSKFVNVRFFCIKLNSLLAKEIMNASYYACQEYKATIFLLILA